MYYIGETFSAAARAVSSLIWRKRPPVDTSWYRPVSDLSVAVVNNPIARADVSYTKYNERHGTPADVLRDRESAVRHPGLETAHYRFRVPIKCSQENAKWVADVFTGLAAETYLARIDEIHADSRLAVTVGVDITAATPTTGVAGNPAPVWNHPETVRAAAKAAAKAACDAGAVVASISIHTNLV